MRWSPTPSASISRPNSWGYGDWHDFLARYLDAGLSLFDGQLSDAEFIARDDFQMNAGKRRLAPIARELLDRANPTGSWAKLLGDPVDDLAAAVLEA
jgi:hypothetical protein